MQSLTPIETMPLGDLAFEKIRTAIISGELAPGGPLSDRTLSEALGVSRTPVREALHRLEAAGLVQSVGRSGWRIVDFTERDVHELFQLRRLLEPAGIDALKESGDQDALANLVHFFDSYEHPIPQDEYRDYFVQDHSFHQLIVQCTGNRRLVDFYAVMGNHINRGRYFLTMSMEGRADATLDEHRAISTALGAGDFRGARRALIEHLTNGERLMTNQLKAQEDHR